MNSTAAVFATTHWSVVLAAGQMGAKGQVIYFKLNTDKLFYGLTPLVFNLCRYQSSRRLRPFLSCRR
jgi:hypothetical protein